MHWLHRLPSLESNVCCFCCFLSDHYWCRSAQEKKGAEADCHFSTYLTAANHSHLSQVLISGERCQDPRNGVTPPNRQMCTILASSSVRSSKGDSGCGEILQSAFHVNWGAKCKTFSRKCFCVQCLWRVILVATCKYYVTLVSRVSSFSWPAYFFNSHIFTIPGRRSQLHSAFSFSFVRDLFLCECWYQAHCTAGPSLWKSSTPRTSLTSVFISAQVPRWQRVAQDPEQDYVEAALMTVLQSGLSGSLGALSIVQRNARRSKTHTQS